ncbi:hypothetical protein NQD34_005975 [Periophthalmus magnuspinnatus]|nr:hypothetical protein NQD34_005975 [Periophthalmus magnuspinnatus]
MISKTSLVMFLMRGQCYNMGESSIKSILHNIRPLRTVFHSPLLQMVGSVIVLSLNSKSLSYSHSALLLQSETCLEVVHAVDFAVCGCGSCINICSIGLLCSE